MAAWTGSRDGELRTNLRLTVRASLDDLARYVAVTFDTDTGEELDARPVAEVEEQVRETLLNHGQDAAMDAEVHEIHRVVARRVWGPVR